MSYEDFKLIDTVMMEMREKAKNPRSIDRRAPYNALKKLSDHTIIISEALNQRLFEIDYIIGNSKFSDWVLPESIVNDCFEKEFTYSNEIEGIKNDEERLGKAYKAIEGMLACKQAVLNAAAYINPNSPKVRKGEVRLGSGNYVHHTPPTGNRRLHCLLDEWELYCKTSNIHPLILAFVAHIQFELIHPLNDGNGRTGRLIMMEQIKQVYKLPVPVLLSGELFQPKHMYFEALSKPMFLEEWEESLEYFVDRFESALMETLNFCG